jgi:two-component system chemotaxis response regulator CheB
MAGHDIIVLGASAGGIEVLKTVISALPQNIPAALFAVVHVGAQSENLLAQVFAQVTPLEVRTAERGDPIKQGRLLIARADHHLLLKEHHVEVTRGPRENLWRPSVDVLFRSAAVAHGPRVIAVVLSGSLDDGSAGIRAIKRCRGLAIAQDPQEASFPSMPEAAIRTGCVNHVLATKGIAPMILKLVGLEPSEAVAVPHDLRLEVEIAASGRSSIEVQEKLGQLSQFTCAECGGPLWKQREEPLRFRCLTGHGYTADALLEASGNNVDSTLWVAMRQFEQRAALQSEMAAEYADSGRERLAAHYRAGAAEMQAHAEVLRNLLLEKTAA